MFEGKVGGPLIVVSRCGHSFALAELNFWLTYNGLIIPGSTYWNVAFGLDKGDVLKDERGMSTAWDFGKAMEVGLPPVRKCPGAGFKKIVWSFQTGKGGLSQCCT
jgi:multimeric flavodoxin WrbA